MDVDLLVDSDPENEARVFSALSTLPDNAAAELRPGELQNYRAGRVARIGAQGKLHRAPHWFSQDAHTILRQA
jgi:hypothetical protein